jgi:hypothetical protein
MLEDKATLVLDLDETLVHTVVDPSTSVVTTHQRPGLGFQHCFLVFLCRHLRSSVASLHACE